MARFIGKLLWTALNQAQPAFQQHGNTRVDNVIINISVTNSTNYHAALGIAISRSDYVIINNNSISKINSFGDLGESIGMYIIDSQYVMISSNRITDLFALRTVAGIFGGNNNYEYKIIVVYLKIIN